MNSKIGQNKVSKLKRRCVRQHQSVTNVERKREKATIAQKNTEEIIAGKTKNLKKEISK